MITQLLISVSIVSLLFSLSSSTLHYQNLHYFSSNSFHLMTIAMNKNCIFLIFNGILVFLAKTSVLVLPPSPSDLDDMLPKRIGNDELRVETEAETLILDKYLVESSLSTEENEDEDENEDENEDEYEDENEDEDEDETQEEEGNEEFEHSNESVGQALIAIEENDGSEDDEKNDELHLDGRDQEESNGGEEVDEIEKLSNEELNKKFEDFIRRMKEEFRINQCQQQQLVLVK